MKTRKLQGTVLEIEKIGDSIVDEEGNRWEKCIFIIQLNKFSKRTPEEGVPENLRGKKVKIIRYCCFDWHYKINVWKTLEIDETEAVLKGIRIKTAYR